MATRSTIGYETPDGGYVGCYAHYDGYPDHMGPILSKMLVADVAILVQRGLSCGGIRCLNEGGDHEFFNDDSDADPTTEWPSCPEEFSYRKRLDGRLEYIHYDGEVHLYEEE